MRIVGAIGLILATGLLLSCGGGQTAQVDDPLPAISDSTAAATATLRPPDSAVQPAQATATLQPPNSAATPIPTVATATATGQGGTVLATRLNVRAGAAVTQPQIGVLSRDERVQVLGRQDGWLQIAFQDGAGGVGWVSASYVAIDGEPTPVAPTAQARATATPRVSNQSIAAPRAISYREPNFTWEWSGQSQVAGVPWYFDILIFTHSGSTPYHGIQATLADVGFENGVWKLNRQYGAQCDSYWVVQIASGTPTDFRGWISERSNRQPIGEACAVPTQTCDGCP